MKCERTHHHFVNTTWRHRYRHYHHRRRHNRRLRPIIGFSHVIPSLTIPILFIHVYCLRSHCIGMFSSPKPPLFPIPKLPLTVTIAHVFEIYRRSIRSKIARKATREIHRQRRQRRRWRRWQTEAAVVATANGDDRGCIDLCARSAARGAPHRPASMRISTLTPRLCCTVSFLLSSIFFPSRYTLPSYWHLVHPA